MSVFNGENKLEDSIKSVLGQTFKNFEFLILNDGSIDNTKKILLKYQNKDIRIKLFENETNKGLTKSLNFLLKLTKGQYIARQDHDDLSKSNRIEEQLKFIEKHDLDACTTRAYVMNQNRITPHYSFYLPPRVVMKFKNPFIHGTLLIKKNIIMNLGGYDENYYFAQDYKLYKDLIKNNYKIKQMQKPYYVLNTTDNISSKFKEEQKKFFIQAKKCSHEN